YLGLGMPWPMADLCNKAVQDYTEFSSDAAKKSPETLKKFESVIFSNIVTTPKKIPSTFDGIESITNLISLAKKSK
ncbi:hypothetical protein, partial [Comamonas aquatica]|uniref:hypothetical protein n=1 Tax=Comamonas aquatica TaxID=225991 RepID=UPI0028D2F500